MLLILFPLYGKDGTLNDFYNFLNSYCIKKYHRRNRWQNTTTKMNLQRYCLKENSSTDITTEKEAKMLYHDRNYIMIGKAKPLCENGNKQPDFTRNHKNLIAIDITIGTPQYHNRNLDSHESPLCPLCPLCPLKVHCHQVW